MLLAFDIGGTKTIAALGVTDPISGETKILDSDTFSTLPNERTRGEFCALCARKTKNMLVKLGKAKTDITAVGISAPGMVGKDGRLIFAPVTGWRDCDLAGELMAELGISVPFGIDNDVNACALAEHRLSGVDNMLWVTVSTGIGGAVIADGKLLRGKHNVSGEIGHVKVEYEPCALECECGQKGCVEIYASGTAVGENAKLTAESEPNFAAMLAERGLDCSAKSLAVLAREGDKTALSIFNTAGDYLGRALSVAQNLLDTDVIFIGGGMAGSLDLMLPAIRKRMKDDIVEASRDVEIRVSALGYEASLAGAFALAQDAVAKR